MKTDQTARMPKPDRWTLSQAKVLELLHNGNLTPLPGSPFRGLRAPAGSDPVPKQPLDAPGILEAVARVARPDIICGLLHWPPVNPDVAWFYGVSGDPRFAAHRRNENQAHHLVWPVADQALLEVMETALSIEEPAVTEGFALSLNRFGFETLITLVDLIQEDILRAAVNRQPPSPFPFDLPALFGCYQRNLQGVDLRWMVQRAKLFAPVRLASDPESLQMGLNALVAQNVIARENGLYAPTPRFYTVCSLLAANNGFCALSTRHRGAGSPAGDASWVIEHVAAARGVGTLWQFEFTNISSSDFMVGIGDVDRSLLRERLKASLHTPARAAAATARDAVAHNEQAHSCRNCGAEMGLAAAFCSACGCKKESIAACSKSASQPTPSPAPGDGRCLGCGAVLQADNQFCTRCGSTVAKPERASRPATAAKKSTSKCLKCGTIAQTGKKFCTQCGASLLGGE